jgi:hypothetical protein
MQPKVKSDPSSSVEGKELVLGGALGGVKG